MTLHFVEDKSTGVESWIIAENPTQATRLFVNYHYDDVYEDDFEDEEEAWEEIEDELFVITCPFAVIPVDVTQLKYVPGVLH